MLVAAAVRAEVHLIAVLDCVAAKGRQERADRREWMADEVVGRAAALTDAAKERPACSRVAFVQCGVVCRRRERAIGGMPRCCQRAVAQREAKQQPHK